MSANQGMTPIGEGIAFYAEFPREMDLLYWNRGEEDEAIESLYGTHFKGELTRPEFDALIQRVDRVGESLSSEAQVITNRFHEEMMFPDWIARAEVIGQPEKINIRIGREWLCKYRIRAKQFKSATPIEIGMVIEVVKDRLLAYSWIWIKGADRSDYVRCLRKSPQGVQFLPEYTAGLDEIGTLYLGIEPLFELTEKNYSVELLVEKLVVPFQKFSPDTWRSLLELTVA